MNIEYEKNIVYKNFSDYYGNPVFTKVSDTPINKWNISFSIYYCKVGCMLCIDDRYLVVLVENDNMLQGNKERLSNLKWISFQTRTVRDLTMNLKSVDMQPKNIDFMNQSVSLSEYNESKYIYISKIMKIELLCDEDTSQYSQSGTIKSCLETYNCVVSFIV